MKKFLALLLTVAMVGSLTACGGSSTEETASESTEAAAETTEATEVTEEAEAPADAQEGDLPVYVVGICQLVQHDALDAATQGFKDALTEEMDGKAIISFDEQNAQGDSNTCSTIINGFVSNGVDLILANATPALQAAAAGTNEIPILGTSVTEYGVALESDNFNGTVGGNSS